MNIREYINSLIENKEYKIAAYTIDGGDIVLFVYEMAPMQKEIPKTFGEYKIQIVESL